MDKILFTILNSVKEFQKKGYIIEEVKISDYDCYFITFSKFNDKYSCSSSRYCCCYPQDTPEQIKSLLRDIHSILIDL